MNPKHKSKLLLGFDKQVIRQDAKPSIKHIEIYPVILSFDEEEYKYLPLKKTVWNNKWNGMNLKNLRSELVETPHNSFNSNRQVSKDGRYKLSIRGRQALNRKRKRKAALQLI